MTTAPDFEIINNADAKRFEAHIGDQMAFVEYIPSQYRMIYTHTEVPVSLEGQGIGNRLAEHVMRYAQEQGLKVNPMCPFIKMYVSKHPEYHSITMGFH